MLGYVLGLTLVFAALSFGFITESFADNSFNVNFDKKQYHPGDSLIISGEILDLGMPVIAVSIFDPSGKILSANNLEISSENTFSKSISLVSPFYEKTGEYTAKLDYGQISESHHFTIVGDNPETKAFEEEPAKEEPKILLLYTEKNQYADKDIIQISGQVSSLDSPTVLIGVYDPFGMPVGFYFGLINSDLEFSTSFLIKSGVNFKTDGTYSIKAHYAETEAVSVFDYSKITTQHETKTSSQDSLEDKTKKTDDDKKSSDGKNSDKLDNDKEVSSNSSNKKTIPKKEATSSDNDDSGKDSATATEGKHKHEPKSSDDDSIVQKNKIKIVEDKKTDIPEIKQIQTIISEKNNLEKIPQNPEPKKHTNLSVEDVELGKLLNQINLECDPSILTDTISYYDGMGPALYRLCNFESSLNSFNDSLIDNPNDVEILVNKGSALGKLGFFSEAIVYYDQAIAINPDFLPAKNNKANALVNLGSLDDAISIYHEILDDNPDYVTAQKNLELTLSKTLSAKTAVDAFASSPSSLKADKSDRLVFEDKEEEPSQLLEKFNSTNNPKEKPTNFFEEVGFAFSSLGSLFGFM